MEDKTYSVYMHENKINHKKYFGITSQDPEERWRKGNNYKTCKAMNHAIEKYGWDGFDHVILYTGQNCDEACRKEIQLIREYNTQDPRYGYNICSGGGGVTGIHHTEETKRKISEAMCGENNPNYGGKTVTEYQRDAARKLHLGSHHTEETKSKISKSLLKLHRHQTEKQKQAASLASSHPVQRSDGVTFQSVKKAATEMGVTYTAISNAIRREQRCGGYYWKYIDKA